MDHTSHVETVREKIHDIRTALFSTMSAEGIKSRPMTTQELQDDGTLLFMTSRSSDKVKEIQADPRVNVSYAGTDGVRYVSISGTATTVDDHEKIKELWTKFHELWFDGPDDPDITLIRVDMGRVEYWDHDGGKVGAYIDMAKDLIIGKKDEEGKDTGDQNEVVHL